MTLNLELEDRAETERLFGLLSEGGSDLFGLQDMPWGAYWGTCADRFGVRWMFNCYPRRRGAGRPALTRSGYPQPVTR